MLKLIAAGSVLGLAASLYALHIETELALSKANPDAELFVPACGASCASVLSSSYSHILSQWGLVEAGSTFDLSNAILGAGFYALALLWSLATPLRRLVPPTLFIIASVGTVGFSLYLAAVLKFVLKQFCYVCASMYLGNAIIFVGTARELMSSLKKTSKPAGKVA